ncbi:hypothetical protein RCCWILLIS_68 [Rhodobacter phage RcCWillis]|nr:hypothetical protein RCCWILLIS_68 [Rhodobacter phage RcCWillis]
MTCRAIQYSDEMHCAQCGLRWDVNDAEPPECGADEDWIAREGRLAQYGDLDAGVPNNSDPSKRGFYPK